MSNMADAKRIVQPTLIFHTNSFEGVYLKYLFCLCIDVFKFALHSQSIPGQFSDKKDRFWHTGFGRFDESRRRKKDKRPAGAYVAAPSMILTSRRSNFSAFHISCPLSIQANRNEICFSLEDWVEELQMTEDATSAADTSPETLSDSGMKDEELETVELQQPMGSPPAESDVKIQSMPPPVLKTSMPPPASKSAPALKSMAPPPPKCSSNMQPPTQKETAYTRPEWSGCPSAEEFPYFFEVSYSNAASCHSNFKLFC
jgi:hypothetical protein